MILNKSAARKAKCVSTLVLKFGYNARQLRFDLLSPMADESSQKMSAGALAELQNHIIILIDSKFETKAAAF